MFPAMANNGVMPRRAIRRGVGPGAEGLDGPHRPAHGLAMLHPMIPVSFYWTDAT